ncbi:MAG TPA: nuclear transport factor 2 family protein [Ktedonobacteraceae bacterium]|nr:nuclear transport factor 2 family protein [Ktedonobacteraceae bacterium]
MAIADRETFRLLVNSWISAFNAHDVAAIVALYAGDAELFDSGMKRPRTGHSEIKQWFSKRFQDMPSIRYEPLNLFFAEEQAVVQWTASGRPSLLGQHWLTRPFRVEGVSIFTFRDGRIQKQRGYYDHYAAVAQAFPPLKWLLPPRL